MTSNEHDPSAAETPMTYEERLAETSANVSEFLVLDGTDVETPPEESLIELHDSGLPVVSQRWKLSTVHAAAEVPGISDADAAGLGITGESELTFSYAPQCISQDDEGARTYEPVVTTVQIRQPGASEATRYTVTQSFVPGRENVVGTKRTVDLNSAEHLIDEAEIADEATRDAGLRALDKLMDSSVNVGEGLSEWLSAAPTPEDAISEDESAHLYSLTYDIYAARRDAAPDPDTQA